jgi:hypothetical protein
MQRAKTNIFYVFFDTAVMILFDILSKMYECKNRLTVSGYTTNGDSARHPVYSKENERSGENNNYYYHGLGMRLRFFE